MQKKISKLFILLSLLIIVTILISLFITRETLPSSDTRIILEHTYKSYIAPVCFEESNATNFLEDSTLQKAQDLNYKPHNSCTENALKAENDSLFKSILKEIDIIDKKWDNW